MAVDIVKYLRLSQTRFNRHAEAADEIERLRKWAEHLESQVEFWRTTAWKAIENTDKALTIIELHKALKAELEKATLSD